MITDYRALVLDFNQNTRIATCFDRVSRRLVKIQVDLKMKPLPGKIIYYPKSARKGSEVIVAHVNSENAHLEDAGQKDCVKVENGKLEISAWIGFSNNPRHKTYDRNLAFGDWYGLIDNSQFRQKAIQLEEKTGKRLFASSIVINDLNYLKNNTQLFKVSKLKSLLIIPPEVTNFILEQLDSFEENLTTTERVIASASTPKQSKSHPVQRLCRNAEPSFGANRPSLSDSRPIPSSSHSPGQLCRKGIAMTVALNGDLIIWMCGLNAVAVLKRTCPNAHSVRLGSVFECTVQKQGFCFNVTEVRRMVERLMPFRAHENRDGSFEAEFVVDVCTPNFKFNFWTIYTGIAVLNSEHVGMVTTADKIETPTGEVKKFYQMMRTYMGDPRSARMIGRCRLEEQRLPRMVVDENYDGSEIVLQYHWKLYRLSGYAPESEKSETDLRKTNES